MRKIQPAQYAYIESCYPQESDHQKLSRELALKVGLSEISISQTEAHFLRFILNLIKPQKILEIGTLTGLSAQYFLETLSNQGQLYTLEKSAEHVKLASRALEPWIKKGQCHIIEGDAREILKQDFFTNEKNFDAIFIDGNKAAYLDYWNYSKNHVRSGGVVVIDNVFLSGSVWGEQTFQKFSEKQINIMKEMTQSLLSDPLFESSFVPTEEGLLLALKK